MRLANLISATVLAVCWPIQGAPVKSTGPFLQVISETESIIGNDLWNLTHGRTFGTKLYYNGRDLVGNAWGHYVSYNG